MPLVIVRHRIEDYAHWKKEFDAFLQQRRAGGETAFRVAHTTSDKNNLFVVAEWDTAANAKRFLDSPEVKARMKQAGVCDTPDIWICDEVASGRT